MIAIIVVVSCFEVYAAEAKLCQVETSIERIQEMGKVEGQMKSLLEETLTKVKKAFAVFVQSM